MIVCMKTTRFSRRDRDYGLKKVGAITRWTLAGSALAGTGFFAGLAAQSGRGATAATAGNPGAGATSRRPTTTTSPTNQGDDGYGFGQSTPVQSPTVLPSPSSGFAPIVSGAS